MSQINRLAVNKTVSQTRNPNVTQFNRNDYMNQPPPPPTLSNVLVYGNKASKAIDMSGNNINNANQITATTFVGALSGNSTRATNIAGGSGGSIPYQSAVNTTALLPNGNSGQVLTSQGTTLPPQWTTLATPATPTLASVMTAGNSASTTLNMNTNAITNITTATATTFVGDLNGNATTATNATNATTATNANNIKTTTNSVSSNFYIPFVSTNSTSNQSLLVNNLTYNPSTSSLTATTFTGALVGNASSATSATTATTATNITTVSDNTSGTYYIPFSKTTAQTSTALYLDDTTTALTYNPSTATISTSNINGTSGINLQYNGTTQSTITTNGVQETLLTTQGTATFSTTTLTMVTTGSAPYPTLYTNSVSIPGTTNTISAITPPANMPINAMYMVYITNSGTGVLTINATGFTNIKTTYTNAVSIPASGFALGTLTKLSSTLFIWSVNVVA